MPRFLFRRILSHQLSQNTKDERVHLRLGEALHFFPDVLGSLFDTNRVLHLGTNPFL